MNKMSIAAAAALMTLAMAGQASAADMAVKARPYDPCGVARFTGFYFGGNVGAIANKSNPSDLDGFLTDNSGWTATDIAATAGVQVGYDWQSCNKVFGLVADWNWTNAKTDLIDEPSNAADEHSVRSRMHWFSTIRARAGLAMNDALVYITGGAVAANIKTSITDAPDSFTFDKTRWGLVGGAGAEFALGGHWSLNTEVLYMQFAKEDADFIAGVTPFSFDLHDSAWVARVGLNYRWDDPRPVSAGAMYGKGVAPLNPCGPSRFGGFYFGGNAGALAYGTGREDLDGFLTDNSGWNAIDIAAAAGVQIGFDWQSCNKVFGLVADWNWTNAKTTTLDNPNVVAEDNAIHSKMHWFSTIRGRAGLAVNDTLVYVTGGVAAANIKTTITDTNTFSFDKTRWGLVGGAGAEFAMGANWSVNAEVLYMQFEKETVNFISGATPFSFDLNDAAWVARVGLNYRWDATGRGMAPFNPCGPARFGGFYVAGNVGGTAYTAGRNDLDGFLTDNSGWTATDMAAAIGGQIGFDWQSCNKVLGIVADLSWTNAKASTFDNPNVAAEDNAIQSKMHWFGTIRGRAGLAVNDTLVYVTGGVAAANIKTTITDTNSYTFDQTRWGLVGGAGAEFAMGANWSVNTEVLYMLFANDGVSFVDTGTPFSFDFNDAAWVGRVGLVYRWGGDRGPVMAKY